MTIYKLGVKRMPEKTWPVNVGEETRNKLLAIQAKLKGKPFELDVTHRAIVQSAINRYYEVLMKTEG